MSAFSNVCTYDKCRMDVGEFLLVRRVGDSVCSGLCLSTSSALEIQQENFIT